MTSFLCLWLNWGHQQVFSGPSKEREKMLFHRQLLPCKQPLNVTAPRAMRWMHMRLNCLVTYTLCSHMQLWKGLYGASMPSVRSDIFQIESSLGEGPAFGSGFVQWLPWRAPVPGLGLLGDIKRQIIIIAAVLQEEPWEGIVTQSFTIRAGRKFGLSTKWKFSQ